MKNIEIPYLEFPEEMKVKVVPAEKDAIVSFVTKQDDREAIVSLVKLPAHKTPCWRIKPHGDNIGWTSMMGLAHTDQLFDTIRGIFNHKGSSTQDIKTS